MDIINLPTPRGEATKARVTRVELFGDLHVDFDLLRDDESIVQTGCIAPLPSDFVFTEPNIQAAVIATLAATA